MPGALRSLIRLTVRTAPKGRLAAVCSWHKGAGQGSECGEIQPILCSPSHAHPVGILSSHSPSPQFINEETEAFWGR